MTFSLSHWRDRQHIWSLCWVNMVNLFLWWWELLERPDKPWVLLRTHPISRTGLFFYHEGSWISERLVKMGLAGPPYVSMRKFWSKLWGNPSLKSAGGMQGRVYFRGCSIYSLTLARAANSHCYVLSNNITANFIFMSNTHTLALALWNTHIIQSSEPRGVHSTVAPKQSWELSSKPT